MMRLLHDGAPLSGLDIALLVLGGLAVVAAAIIGVVLWLIYNTDWSK